MKKTFAYHHNLFSNFHCCGGLAFSIHDTRHCSMTPWCDCVCDTVSDRLNVGWTSHQRNLYTALSDKCPVSCHLSLPAVHCIAYSALFSSAVHYFSVQCISAMHCIAMQYTVFYWNSLYCSSVHCIAVQCSLLKFITLYCSGTNMEKIVKFSYSGEIWQPKSQ